MRGSWWYYQAMPFGLCGTPFGVFEKTQVWPLRWNPTQHLWFVKMQLGEKCLSMSGKLIVKRVRILCIGILWLLWVLNCMCKVCNSSFGSLIQVTAVVFMLFWHQFEPFFFLQFCVCIKMIWWSDLWALLFLIGLSHFSIWV